jgi:hypothetical protein
MLNHQQKKIDRPGSAHDRRFPSVAAKRTDVSTPATAHPDMPSAAECPMTAKPNCAAVWRMDPDARNPNPSHAIPIPVAGRPNIIRPRLGRRSNVGGRRWRRLRSGRDRIRRRFGRNRGGRRRRRRGISSSHGWRRGINGFVLNTSARDHPDQSGQRRNIEKSSFHT